MMYKIAVAAVLCGLASAELRHARDIALTQSIIALRDDVAILKAEMSAVTLAQVASLPSAIHGSDFFQKSTETDKFVKTNAAVAAEVPSLARKIRSLAAHSAGSTADTAAGVALQLKVLSDDLASKVASNSQILKALQGSQAAAAKLASEVKKIDAISEALEKKVTSNVAAKLKAGGEKIKDKMEKTRHVFSAGPRQTHQGGGWHDFAMDRVEYDTLAPYAKHQSSTRIRILKDGLFHFRFVYMGHSGWCHRHGQFYVNGKNIISSYHNWSHHWHHSVWEITWVFKANQEVWGRVYACNHAWHGTGSGIDAYDRMQIEYIGQIDTDNCSGEQCKGV